MATLGATHGLHLVGSVMFSPGNIVFLEDPTYFIAIDILRDELGMDIEPGNIYFNDRKQYDNFLFVCIKLPNNERHFYISFI